MSIRIITKTTGRIYSRMHSILFHMGKGNYEDGNPYGIIPTGLEDPLGLTMTRTKPLKITIKPGQFCCYGRQCIIDEETTIIEDMAEAWKLTNRCYLTVYAEINLNDIVNQTCELKVDMRQQSFVDFKNDMERQNLFKRANGIYDVPIGRMIYEPQPSREDYFYDYEKLIGTFSEQARGEAKNIQSTIFGLSVYKTFKDGYCNLTAEKAEYAKGTDAFGKKNPIAILNDLRGVYTCKRKKIIELNSSILRSGSKAKCAVNIDWDHLEAISIFIESKKPKISFTSYYSSNATTSHVSKVNVSELICSNKMQRAVTKADKLKGLGVYLKFIFPGSDEVSYPYSGSMYLSENLANDGGNGNAYMLGLWIGISSDNDGLIISGQFPETARLNNYNYLKDPVVESPVSIYADFIYKGDVNLK